MTVQQTSGGGQQTECEACGKSFVGRQARQRFCSSTCRSRGNRGTVMVTSPTQPKDDDDLDSSPVELTGLVAATRAELETAGRVNSMLGQSALLLAAQMCSNRVALGSAALNKELRATMVAALQGAVVADDPVDELRRRRDAKRAG